MKFQYTALTGENKKITGVLDVENEEAAQGELHKMGVAIISVAEISEADYEQLKIKQEEAKLGSGIQTFTFVALDPNKKEIEGTIDAKDDYSAYKRLKTEYQFTVNELFPPEANEAQKTAVKAKFEAFEAQLNQEQAIAKGEKQAEDGIEEGEGEINEEIVAEVDKVVVNTKKALEAHKELYSNELLQEIGLTLGELERIRSSNNIKHITEVSNDLYSLISNPDKIDGESGEAHQQLMSEIQESALVQREFDLYSKAVQATGLKRVFANISDRFKKLTETTEEEEKKPSSLTNFKKSIHEKLDKFTKKKAKLAKPEKEKGKFGIFIEKLSSYFKTTSPVLKKTRKREMINALKAIFGKGKKAATEQGAQETTEGVEADSSASIAEGGKAIKKKADFTPIFVEIDSFVGWLLMFYIAYFFLVGFALEKDVGLPREFIFKTLKTPLLLNISILLLLVHFVLRIKNLHLRNNVIATFFLVALTLGVYTLLMVNF